MEPFSFAQMTAVRDFTALADPSVYRAPPSEWWVVVTDVAGSTAAIEAGRYKDVNVLGAASIVAAKNAAGSIELPYVFGGDGATIIVPPDRIRAVAGALKGLSEIAQTTFGLGLRVGGVTVADVRARGAEFGIARFELAPDVSLAMFWGEGVSLAEDLVKGSLDEFGFDDAPVSPDLGGLQCRWKPIPSRNGEMLSVLVKATANDGTTNATTYAEIFGALDQMGLNAPERTPIDTDRLELATTAAELEAETSLAAATGSARIANTPRVRWTNKIGRALMSSRLSLGGFDGARYPASLVARTDFRKFDDALRMVVDVDEDTRAKLEKLLAGLRADGRIAFGIHASDRALMTCIIQDYDTRHVHFIDGSDGGYALAAKQLKRQLREDEDV